MAYAADAPRRARAAELAAAGASLGAGAIHGALVREHLAEWWGYGLFFALAALVQLLAALALATRAVNERDTGPRWRSVRRGLLWVGLLANAGLIAVYAVSRTVGVPLLGPEAGEVEPVDAVGLASKALELAAVAAFVLLLRWDSRSASVDARP